MSRFACTRVLRVARIERSGLRDVSLHGAPCALDVAGLVLSRADQRSFVPEPVDLSLTTNLVLNANRPQPA